MVVKIHQAILKWYRQYGRHELPWRLQLHPYRVWLSEIMLQQTQVKTVLPYFAKFTKRFANIQDLANAPLDEVLQLWAGLGYYSRARNLHATAKIICSEHRGNFPDEFEKLIRLPGIGRSTAGAILAIAFNKKAAILDGNVQRIMARFFGVATANLSNALRELWCYSESLVPEKKIQAYTQALMDLGALICTPKNPKCELCPIQKNCYAAKNNLQTALPLKKEKKIRPLKKKYFLLVQNHKKELLFYRREPLGIWGGLWSIPECTLDENIEQFCLENFAVKCQVIQKLTKLKHQFTHYTLELYPVKILIDEKKRPIIKNKTFVWTAHQKIFNLALPAPIKKILESIHTK